MSGKQIYQKLSDNIEKVIKGQKKTIRKLLACFFSGGHVLLEDVPGTGKTTMAKALAKSIDIDYQRIQFTPDLLPTDILGVSIYDQKTNAFNFHKGPVFTNILLGDEINRASPRTQSALLEAMAESQISIDGKLYILENPFFVIATQNPIEFHGTYPLPEAQMDRFTMRFKLGYVSVDDEITILSDQNKQHPINLLQPCTDINEFLEIKSLLPSVRVGDELKKYIVDIIRATRNTSGVLHGASPRASLSLMKVAQALAIFEDMEYITPEHIQELAVDIISHRLVLDSEAEFSGLTTAKVVIDILNKIPAPV